MMTSNSETIHRKIRILAIRILFIHFLSFVFLSIVGIAYTSNVNNVLSKQIAASVQKPILIGDLRQVILDVEVQAIPRFAKVEYIRDAKIVLEWPMVEAVQRAGLLSGFDSLIYGHYAHPIKFSDAPASVQGFLVFYYNRFEALPVIIAIWFVLSVFVIFLFNKSRKELIKQSAKDIVDAKKSAIVEMARQVAHDVHSPLAALDTLTSSALELAQDKRVIMRSAVNRIRDIANGLSEKNWEALFAKKGTLQDINKQSTTVTCDLPQILHAPSLVDVLISEKRIEYQKRTRIELDAMLGSSAYGLFISVQPAEFKRALSNLINNAIESLGEAGQVQISVVSKAKNIEITVTDNGKGIPPEVLEKLGKERISHEKKGGSGRGLYHAIELFNSWGGNLEIESEVGKGTTVRVILPRVKTPSWFVPELKFIPNSTVIVVDDDLSIHQLWQERFDRLELKQKGIEVIHFNAPQELRNWVAKNPTESAKRVYLVDFEYADCDKTGVQAIESAGIGPQSILVTSWYEERSVVENCERLGVKLIPKGFVGFVPISVEEAASASTKSNSDQEVVLIDDDEMVHLVWNFKAKEAGLTLHIFTNADEFFKNASDLNKEIAIYVDSNLGDGVKGENVSREISKLGFKNISLATGYPASSFPEMPWLKRIIGKEPPF